MTSAAGSGHPSSALSLAHLVVALMYRHMRFDPADPWNLASDRLVLSEGHAAPIVYAAYADLGGVVGTSRGAARRLTIDELSSLRALRSVLDGHPNPAEGFPFFDAATGSLGQGLSVAAGLALAARLDGIDKHIYCLIGDGESREGQIWEAADFIVDHKLTSVCAIVNCNGLGQADYVSKQQSAERVSSKFTAFGWTTRVIDGHDFGQIFDALAAAGSGERPLAIVARTTKGWGVPLLQGEDQHGKPVPSEKVDEALAQLDETARRLGVDRKASKAKEEERTPRTRPNEKLRTTSAPQRVTLPPFEQAAKAAGYGKALEKKSLATRAAYGIALSALGDVHPGVVVLDGDVSNSTYTNIFAKRHPERFFECKIAEQNMVSVGVGLFAGGKLPFANSFAKFIARAYDQIEMASITRANLKLVGSHSGVSLAADGPSQMSLADVAYFRSYTRTATGEPGTSAPACVVFQPADAISAYRCTELMANHDGLCYMRTHRPDAPFLYALDERFEIGGCHRLREGKDLTLVSSGFMLTVALRAADRLAEDGIKCTVFDAYSFPLDAAPILSAARYTSSRILTIEDNYIGGLFSELAEAAAPEQVAVYGLTCRRIPKSARTADEVFKFVGVSVGDVVEGAKKCIALG